MNPNDEIVAGNVDDGGALALEDAYAAPVKGFNFLLKGNVQKSLK